MLRRIVGIVGVWSLLTGLAGAQTLVNLPVGFDDGSIAANATTGAELGPTSFGTVLFQVTGTFNGTIELQCSLDGSTYQAVRITPTNSSSAVTSVTSTGVWTGAGCRYVRARSTAWTSGTATTYLWAIPSGGSGGSSSGGSAGTEFAEDAAHASGDNGTMTLGVRKDTATALAGTDGDYQPFIFDSSGRLWASANIATINGTTPVATACEDQTKINTADVNLSAGTGNTEIVALNGTEIIYLCGYVLTAGGDTEVQWITGTGTACATGETDKGTLDFNSTKGYGISVPVTGAAQMKTSAGGALCVERSASVTLKGYVAYVRQ